MGLGGLELLLGGLVGHFGPQEAGEFAGDGDGHDGGAFPLLGEVAMAGEEADLRVPGAAAGLGAGLGRPGWVAVVPGGFGQAAGGRGGCRFW